VYLLDELIPRLDKAGKKYHLFIAGKGLDEKIVSRIKETPNVSYTGFVDDLDIFIRSCDIMVNPVMTGGGIKTKAVEALGYNKIVVSSAAGAAGLMKEVCGNNLQVTSDYDWNAFSEKVITATQQKPAIPQRFYDTYYWDNAARKILSIMNGKLTALRR
jgi:glycosyltransferase involved in cell wall biosynthesis